MNIVKATLISRETADGVSYIHDRVPIGKTYWIDTGSIFEGEWLNLPLQKVFRRPTVKTYKGPEGGYTGEMILELVKVEES